MGSFTATPRVVHTGSSRATTSCYRAKYSPYFVRPRACVFSEPIGRRHVDCSSASSTAQTWTDKPLSTLRGFQHAIHCLYKFSRPHTMIGTTLSILSVSSSALLASSTAWGAVEVRALCVALVAALFANISIVGLNQCFDIEVDRVNKPYLPLASGEWSLNTGVGVVVATGAAAVIISATLGSTPLLVTVVGSLLLGVAYSVDLPFFRWKYNPVAAAGCIITVRAVLVQVGFWAHIRGLSVAAGDSILWYMSAFMAFFSIVIALFKDIPDVKGDALHGNKTASVRMGVPTVFWTCIALLMCMYTGSVGFILCCGGNLKSVVAACQAALAAILLTRAKNVDLKSSADVVSTYMLIWNLFYAQYLMFPLITLTVL